MKTLATVLLFFSFNAIAECPAPKVCSDMDRQLQACIKEKKKAECVKFVTSYKSALGKFNCKRSFDTQAVPAIWLCDGHEFFTDELSKMKTDYAKRVYGSAEFRETLDGGIAEAHREESEKVGKSLKK